jgi:hypothetical protein
LSQESSDETEDSPTTPNSPLVKMSTPGPQENPRNEKMRETADRSADRAPVGFFEALLSLTTLTPSKKHSEETTTTSSAWEETTAGEPVETKSLSQSNSETSGTVVFKEGSAFANHAAAELPITTSTLEQILGTVFISYFTIRTFDN